MYAFKLIAYAGTLDLIKLLFEPVLANYTLIGLGRSACTHYMHMRIHAQLRACMHIHMHTRTHTHTHTHKHAHIITARVYVYVRCTGDEVSGEGSSGQQGSGFVPGLRLPPNTPRGFNLREVSHEFACSAQNKMHALHKTRCWWTLCF